MNPDYFLKKFSHRDIILDKSFEHIREYIYDNFNELLNVEEIEMAEIDFSELLNAEKIDNIDNKETNIKVELLDVDEEDIIEIKQKPMKVCNKAKTTSKWFENLENTFQKGDIIYSEHYDKFGIFSDYGKKVNRMQMNLLCKNSKVDTFKNPWTVPLDSAHVVSRNGIVQKGFIETETGFKKAE